MPDNTEVLLKEVKQELDRVTGEIKQTAEDALKQVKDHGQLAAELKATADKLLVEQTKLVDAQQKLEERQLELEQNGAKNRGERSEPVQSMGHQVASSEQLAQYVAAKAQGSVRIPVKQAITSAAGSGGDLVRPDYDGALIRMPRRRPLIRSLLNQVRTTSNLVQFARQTTRTNNAAVVAENTQKAESAYAWELAEAPVRTIAHWVPIAKQTLSDAAQLQGELDSELRYGLDLAEDEELLNGDGTGQHLDGLKTNATAFAAPFAVDNENLIDTLRLAILQLELADYYFDGSILNPTEWARIELTKDTTGQYVLANPLQMMGPTLWGRPVVPTTAMDAGDFMVGQFEVAATIYDREDAEVLLSTEDRDNFVKNMVTALAEKRLALGIKRAAAMVEGTFTIPA